MNALRKISKGVFVIPDDMQNFLKDVLDYLLAQKVYRPDQCSIILPGKRAGSYLKHLLKTQTDYQGFPPEILSIEEFVTKITGLKTLDQTNSLFRFYETYLALTPKEEQEDFKTFFGWAQTLLHDFNEIDRYVIPTQSFFAYLSDIKNIEHWSLSIPQSDIVSAYLKFWNKLPVYHQHFVENILKNGEAYQGLIYREATQQIDKYLNQTKNHLFFVGFNALNNAEQSIIQQVLARQRGDIFWDIAQSFLENKIHGAGKFIRRYREHWPFYAKEEQDFNWISSHFREEKNIEIIGIPQHIGQAKYVGNLLENADLTKTAVILGDENLLFPVLNSLPENVEKVNITMGLALDKTPTAALFETLFKIQAEENSGLYYKNVLAVISNPIVQKQLTKTAELIKKDILEKNRIYLGKEKLLEQTQGKNRRILEICFTVKPEHPTGFILDIIELTELLRSDDTQQNALENQYLYHFHKVFKKIHNLLEQYQIQIDFQAFQRIYKEILQTETLDFSGSPFDGLQIMGMLETRTLDYETIILTAVNEGILPGGKSSNSFIPHDLKVQYGLPTYREKDAVYTYHFYRLLQRAKNVYLLYNSETSGLNAGEKSRFITQLEVEKQPKHQLTHKLITPKIYATQSEEVQQIEKTDKVLEILQKRAEKGFSPSALTTYIRNPMDFYQRYVLGIFDEDEIEEIISPRTLGNIVHNTLEVFFKEKEGQFVTKEDLQQMIDRIEPEVRHQLKENYREANFEEGENLITFEIAKRFVYNFLKKEEKILKQSSLKILQIESDTFRRQVFIPKLNFPIYLAGKVDRVDEIDGQIRVVDYKTGNVSSTQLKVPDFELLIRDEKHQQAFQVLCYAYMLMDQSPYDEIQAGIISFRNLKSGFMPFTYKDDNHKDQQKIDKNSLDLFENYLKALIEEIFDPSIPFKEKED